MRGTGSLQQLLGRSTFGLKRKNKATDAPPSTTSVPATADAPSENLKAATAPSPVSPLKPRHVRCPICNKQIAHSHAGADDELVNGHIDKCLYNQRSGKTLQQATLRLFAPRAPAIDQTFQSVPSRNPSPQKYQTTDNQNKCHNTERILKPSLGAVSSLEINASAEDCHYGWPSGCTPSRSEGEEQELTARVEQEEVNHDATVCTDGRASSDAPFCFSFSSCVVGRRFQRNEQACLDIRCGDQLLIQPEHDNPRDAHALMVYALAKHERETGDKNHVTAALGHLPRHVAKHLGPLLRRGIASACAMVKDAPLDEKCPLKIEVCIVPNDDTAHGDDDAALLVSTKKPKLTSDDSATVIDQPQPTSVSAVQTAMAAILETCAANGTTTGLRPSEATGERLRRNFATVLATVLESDGSLLSTEEHAFIKAYEGLTVPAQCLFLRLSQRCGEMFRLVSIKYSDVADPMSASLILQTAGLAQCHLPEKLSESVDGAGEPATAASSRNQPLNRVVNRDKADVKVDGVAWEDLASLLTVPELRQVLQKLVVAKGGTADRVAGGKATGQQPQQHTRGAVLGAFRQIAEISPLQCRIVCQELKAAAGVIIALCPKACGVLERLQRLFFLNEGQSLGQFLATDSGAVRYPSYTLNRSCSAFASYNHLLEYEEALHRAEELTIALENEDYLAAEEALLPAWTSLDDGRHKDSNPTFKEAQRGGTTALTTTSSAMPPLFLRRFHSAWVYCLMATAGVSLLERQKRYTEAIERLQQLLGGTCCPGKRGYWWLRLSIDLEHIGRSLDALEMAEAALSDEWLRPGDLLALRRRVLRLGKPPRRWKKPAWADLASREPREVRIHARPLTSVLGKKSVFSGFDGKPCSVEELALQYYASEDGGEWKGMHCEGGIWCTLFGLLMWPALFCDGVEDAFRTPFQTAPLDLDCEGFYSARKDCIESVLARIAHGEAVSLLADAWEQHCGAMCRGVSWERWSLSELQEIAVCVGGPGLAAVCRLLAQDHAGWLGGMPDLLLWHPSRCAAQLSEVKGPRDRLSDQQRSWIAALEDAGLSCEVLKVVENEKDAAKAKRRRRKAR